MNGAGNAMRLAAAVVILTAAASCAPPPPVTAPAAPRHPDFVFPAVPSGRGPDRAAWQGDPALVTRLQQGWFRLQADDLRAADRDFSAVLKRAPRFAPALAAAAYLDVARKRPREAVALADRALKEAPAYAPALAARGEALLALRRDEEALQAFESAVAADNSLAGIQRRVEVLRFREVQQAMTAARGAAASGNLAAARSAYERAIARSPDSGVLYRELALVEKKAGNTAAARAHLEKAVRLDPADARAQVELGELLEQAGDDDRAAAAYRAALALEPDDAVQARLERAEAHARLARLPAEYRAIPSEAQITRGDLAALTGIRLETLLRAAPRRPTSVITDMRGHWAAPWIAIVVRAGVLDIFPNHTFQPRARLRRGEFATALSRLLSIAAAQRPELSAEWERDRRRIADVPTGHLMYPAVSRVVAAGILPLLPGETFQVSRPVSGAEAIAALDRVQALVDGDSRR